jgi:large subunit ribosomal protein L3
MRMAGQMGNVNVKVQNLEVVKVDTATNRIFLKGAVPGHEGNFLKLEK